MTSSAKCLSEELKRVPWTGQPLKVDMHVSVCVYIMCLHLRANVGGISLS